MNKIYVILPIIFYSGFLYSDTLFFVNHFGDFEKAASITSSREEFIFVSDVQKNLIYKFKSDGLLIKDFGGYGFGNSQFMSPVAIDASNNLDIFICDYFNNRIQRFDLNFNYIASFDFNTYNLTADMNYKILFPKGVAFLNTSEIFVICDATNYNLVKLKAFDEVSLFIGNTSSRSENLFEPVKIVTGLDLQIWVLDRMSNNIKNFDNFGSYLGTVGNFDDKIFSIAFFKECLYIATVKTVMVYNTKSKKYTGYYNYKLISDEIPIDIALSGKEKIFILTEKQVFTFK